MNDKVQILLSIMNEKKPDKYLKKMNIKGNYVVINQITNDKINKTNIDNKYSKIISVNEKGLSKSRNLAIDNSDCAIGLLSDDDMYYVDDYQSIIVNDYKKYKDADIIAFVVEHENKKYEKKVFKEGRLSFIKSLRISSVQISFRINSIKEKNIKFDENFGSGSKYYMGEENIFMYDCLKKHLKIYYIPKKIGILKEINESKWFKGYTRDFFEVKGIVFYRMSRLLYIPLILQFAIRKRNNFKKIGILKSIKYMFDGIKKYKKGLL